MASKLGAGWKILIVVASLLVVILILWALTAAVTWSRAGAIDLEGQTRVAVDPQEYAGKWYEIARYPQWFQPDDCVNTTATYTPSADGNRLRVVNECELPSSSKIAKGWAYTTKNPGVFRVSFFPGIYGNYTVVKRGPRLSIVSNPQRSSLWILSRDSDMTSSEYDSEMAWLEANSYDTSKLVRRQ